ncbi:23S rRNA (adenine(2503)-C(2))-methyltransferase RlmN [Bacteroidota bacterium]
MKEENIKTNIKDISLKILEEFILSVNEKRFRSKQIYNWIWKNKVSSFNEMNNIPNSLKNKLENHFSIQNIEIKNTQVSIDKTAKFAFNLIDNEIVEGVLIPSLNRTTACISTQVGCPLACKFCASGQIKFKRNLLPSEIIDQVILINDYSLKEYKRKLSNIVVMGMGEPLLNLDNLIKAIEIVTDENALGFSPQRITVSTSGLVKEIRKMTEQTPKFNLAISLHTANNLKRTNLMPVNKSNPLPELINALKYYHSKTNARITFEYLMLNNVNDSIQDAKELAEFCKNFPSKVNIIEYNEIQHEEYQKSSVEKTQEFVNYLESKNLVVNVRRSRGKEIDAACGQLANKTL